jgi:23S rRNA pseudouridine2605 synthase
MARPQTSKRPTGAKRAAPSSGKREPASASGRRRAGTPTADSPSKPDRSRSQAKSRASSDADERPAKSRRPAAKKSTKQQPFAANEREQREGVRLQKFIASSGVSSRRKAEELILAGKVEVNGKRVTELGTRIYPGRDRVVVRGEPITAENKVYFVLNKPDQVVSSAEGSVDDRGRPTVVSLLHGVSERLYPVGRLDFHTRGVMLLTNDGVLAAALTHPRHGVVKTYHVKFQGKLSPEEEQALREGVVLDDGARTRPLAELFAFRETDANAWYQIGLTEGLNRQLRRMGDAIGHPVLKLIRVAIGDITADGLAEGEFRPLTPTEVALLLAAVEPDPAKRPSISAPTPAPRAAAEAPKSDRPLRHGGSRRSPAEGASSSKRPSNPKRPSSAKRPSSTAAKPGPARKPTRKPKG